MAFAKIKNIIDSGLKSVSMPLDHTASLEPEIGIRIVHSSNEKALRVTVIGARHLPQNFGFFRVNNYVVKVSVTKSKKQSAVVKQGTVENSEYFIIIYRQGIERISWPVNPRGHVSHEFQRRLFHTYLSLHTLILTRGGAIFMCNTRTYRAFSVK